MLGLVGAKGACIYTCYMEEAAAVACQLLAAFCKPTAPSELCNRLWPIHVSHLLASGMSGGPGNGEGTALILGDESTFVKLVKYPVTGWLTPIEPEKAQPPCSRSIVRET